MNNPTYTISTKAIDLVERIAEKLGEIRGAGEYSRNLHLRKITDIFTDINTDKLSKAELEFLEQIAGYLDKNGEITNYRAQLLTNKSDISVKKYFAKLVELGLLQVEGKNKGRKYRIKNMN
jgi:predicted HTH transcriptional regulator